MGIVFKNNAKTTLASGITDTATSATVADGSVFPTLGAGEYFFCTFDTGTQNEIVKVTARSGNTLTIVRAQDNTTAKAFSSGNAAELRVTAGVLENIQENIAAKSANQTIYSTTTASSATSYDIGIDPGVEANASVFLDGVYQHHDTFSFSGSTLTFDAAPVDGTALEVIVDNLINLQSSNLSVDTFTAADVGGSPQTDFTLSDVPGAETNLIVFVDGVFQNQDSYTFSNNTLTMTDGVIADRVVTVYIINPVNIGTPSDGTITSAKLSGDITFPGDITVTGDVAFDSPTFVVDNANSRVGIGTAAPSTLLDIVGDVKMSADLTVDTDSLHVDSANNRVGIGTSSPDRALKIHQDNAYVWIADAAGGNVGFIGGSGANDGLMRLYEGTGHTAKVEIHSNSDSYFNGGYVGIATTNPLVELDVNGNIDLSASSTETRRIEIGTGRSGNGYAFLDLIGDATYSDYGTRLIRQNTGANANTNFIHRGTGNFIMETDEAAPIIFGTDSIERMKIDSSGKVGIGTTDSYDPACKFVVKGTGNSRFDVSATNTNNTLIGSNLVLSDDGTTYTTPQNGRSGGGIQFNLVNSVNNHGDILFLSAPDTNSESSTPVERMRIDSSGNVGIGLTPASTNKLEVFGNIKANASNDKGFLLGGNCAILRQDSTEMGFETNGSEAMRIDSSGNVGIGNADPTAKLEVGDGSSTYVKLRNASTGDISSGYNIQSGSTTTTSLYGNASEGWTTLLSGGSLHFRVNNAVSGYNALNITTSSNVLINTSSSFSSGKLDVLGGTNNAVEAMGVKNNASGSYNVMMKFYTSSGAVGRIDWDNTGSAMGFTNLSDARLKEVTGEARGLDLITKLNPVKYYFKNNDWESEGLVAQEVEQAYQDLGDTPVGVRPPEDEDDYYHLSTGHFVVNLIKAVKEQQEQIEQLKGRIEELENG